MSSLRCRPSAVFVLVAAAGVFASGCGRRATPPAAVTMRIGVGAPAQGVRASGVASVINNLTNETWLTGKPDGRQAERVLSAFSWDGTRTILRLTIRNDVYFHDGTRLTPEIAADILRTNVAHAREEGALGLIGVKSVAVTGPDSLELRLSEPNAFVLPDLSYVNVRKPDAANIGTGPFKLVTRDQQQAVLAAFPQYYRGHPALAGIDVVSYPTQRNAWAALMRGDIDMLYEVSRDAADFVKAESTVLTYTFARPYYIPLVFNLHHPVLKRPEVRTAINEALDKVMLVHEGLRDQGRPADGPIWPEHWAQPRVSPQFKYDPDSARRRLDAAGLTAARGASGAMPARFSFTCLVYGEDSRFERLALLVQKQLADVGIEMNLLPLKSKEMVDRLQSGDFDAFLFELFGRSLSSAYEFWHHHEGALFDTGYVAADGVLDRIRSATSDAETKAAVAELAQVLYRDPPASFIAWQTTNRAVSARFDVAAERDRDILSNVWQWRQVEAPAQAPR